MDLKDLPNIVGPVQIKIPNGMASGVYFLVDGERVVYVGQSRDIRARIGQHLAEGAKHFDGFWYIKTGLSRALKLERRCIEAYRPEYNNCHYSKFLDKSEIEPKPLEIITKRMPRSRAKREVII